MRFRHRCRNLAVSTASSVNRSFSREDLQLMKIGNLRRWLGVISICGLWVPSLSAAPLAPAKATTAPEKLESPYAFSLLPKAFQKHPLLAISVVSEVTDEGKRIKAPTPESPTYYYATSIGYHHEGQGVSEEGKLSIAAVEKRVEAALGYSHYLPATEGHPPTLAIFYFWGVHSKLDKGDMETGEGAFRDVRYHNLLSRAALVGGEKFEKELAKALEQQALSGAPALSLLDPVYRFTNRDDLTRNLMEQVLDDCYYVVISAYEGAALARGEKKLLWRTKMSTPAQGVSLAETTPALISSGRSFIGRPMEGPAIVGKRVDRDGKVEIGDLKFKGYEEAGTGNPNQDAAEKK